MKDTLNPSLVMVQPMKTSPYITERLLMGRKESYQTKKKTSIPLFGQGSHWLEKYLNMKGFLEKSLKMKFALKSTGDSL